MSDEMAEAHRNDYEYERLLRKARMALRAVRDEKRMGSQGDELLTRTIDRLGKEMDYIVRRWD
jgi:hypothetical protein